MNRRHAHWLHAALVALAGQGLGGGCKSDGECRRDNDCAATEACAAQICVPRAGSAGQPLTLAVELDPPPDSAHARRDHPQVSFAADPVALELDGKLLMKALVDSPLGVSSERASSVRAVLAVGSLLPGRPALTFEADAANKGGAQPYEVGLELPAALVGRTARLTVSPLAPLDQVLCPWQIDVAVAPVAQFILPTATDSLVIEGSVLTTTAPGAPVPTHEAKLYLGDRLLSNVARTEKDGKFVLRVQKSQLAEGAMATVEITPLGLDNQTTGSIVLSVPYTGQLQLGLLKIPPASEPMPFKVPVMRGMGEVPVAGAAVRFVTRLDGATGGQARYVRVGQTGPDGVATLPLLLGSGNSTRAYAVSVQPPPDADVGALCVPDYTVGAGGTAAAFGAALRLPDKVTLDGQIKRAGGLGAPGMRVRAVRLLGSGSDEGCGPKAVITSEATADRDGHYRLRLEPGDYRLELEPPVETSLPRHVVATVAVAAGARLDVTLPEALLLEGRVTPPPGTAVGSPVPLVGRTEVRVFRVGGAADADGTLLGSALSNPDGKFRVVVPRPAP